MLSIHAQVPPASWSRRLLPPWRPYAHAAGGAFGGASGHGAHGRQDPTDVRRLAYGPTKRCHHAKVSDSPVETLWSYASAMTLLVNDTVTDAVLVRVVMRGEIDSELKLDHFAAIVDGLAYLFQLAEVRERGIRAAADPIGPIHRSDLHVRVVRISYNSPLEFLLEMLNLPHWANYGAAIAAGVVATARTYATVRLKWAEGSLKRAETRKILAEASEVEMRNAASAQRREANRKACEFLLEELRPQPLQVDAQRLLNAVKALDAIEDIDQVRGDRM